MIFKASVSISEYNVLLKTIFVNIKTSSATINDFQTQPHYFIIQNKTIQLLPIFWITTNFIKQVIAGYEWIPKRNNNIRRT